MSEPSERTLAVGEVFGRAASTYDDVIPFFATFGKRLVDLAGVRAGDRVLDIASGRGASALPAAELAGPEGRVVAIEIATDLAERLERDASRRGVENVDVIVADAQSIELTNAFDVALCGFALHLVEDADRLVGRCYAAMKADGRFAASVPAGGGERWSFFGRILGEFAPRAARPLDKPPPERAYGDVLSAAGFREISESEETQRFTFADADEWWRWVWSHGMRYALEKFDEPVLSEVKERMLAEASELAGPNGLVLDQRVRFFTARK